MPVSGSRTDEILATVAALNAAAARAGYTITGVREIDYGRQVGITDGHTHVSVNVYGGKKGISLVVAGYPGRPLHAALNRIAADLGGLAAMPSAATDPPASMPARGRAAAPTAHAPGQRDRFPPGPWIGSDESGKGDYFGPLVAAAVYVTLEQEEALRAAGVRDSKLLDDGAAHRVAGEVRRLCAGRFAEELLVPEQYNARYAAVRAEGENLNHLLAWGHVHVLEALLAGGDLPASPGSPAPAVIADQFADERYVRERLKQTLQQRGLPMPSLLQAPRAEANVAVAAASILARDRFLGWLAETSARYGIELPKGGSKPAIIAAARRIIEQHGRNELGKVAKLHFVTTKAVTGSDA